MYVTRTRPNAMCIGLDEPVIVLNTGLVELLDEEEMRAVIGHEVGHALSGHAVYRTVLLFLTNLALRVSGIPLGGIAITAIVTALREWFASRSCPRTVRGCWSDRTCRPPCAA